MLIRLLICSLALQPILASGVQGPFIHEPTSSNDEAKRIITDEFSAFANGVRELYGVRGVSLGIVKPGGSVEYGGWGNSTETGDPVTEDTLFAIGSCTKAFLAASLGILMDDFIDGRNKTTLPDLLTTFDWDTKIKDLLPEDWKPKDQWQYEKTSLRDILSHVSGLVGHDFAYTDKNSLKDVVRMQGMVEAPFELRQTWRYNNMMFMVGTYILEKYSGISFEDFLQERIFVPLSMNSTTSSPGIAGKQKSEAWSASGRRIPFWFTEKSAKVVAGAGTIISGSRDMTKWIAMMVNEGVDPVSNRTILSKSTYKAVATASSIVIGSAANEQTSIVGYGMGWMRTSYRGNELVSHGGGVPGSLSLVSFYPDAKAALVCLTNTDTGLLAIRPINIRVTDELLGLPPAEASVADLHTTALQFDFRGPVTLSAKRKASQTGSSTNVSLSIEKYAGTYFSPGYGNITLCARDPSGRTFTTNSETCATVLHNFALTDDAENRTITVPQLLAHSPRIFAQDLRFEHLQADTFKLEALTLFPQGYGLDETPFAYDLFSGSMFATARFILDSAMFSEPRVQGFYACGILRDMADAEGNCLTGEDAKPGALVWFSKL